MNALDEQLARAESDDSAPALGDVLRDIPEADRSDVVRDSVAGPLGHLLCKAATRALASGEPPDTELIDALLAGMTSQHSLLTLNDAVDTLLDSGPFVQQFGQRLCDALLNGRKSSLEQQPLLAAGYMEGALRLAIANAAKPMRVLGALELEDVSEIDAEYAERLPRLIGAALDRWGNDENLAPALRQDLDSLRDVPDAAADATFEFGLDLLRRAANEQAAGALTLLVEARAQMASAVAAEDDRDDAALYGAGLDALMAFAHADRALSTTSRDRVSELLNKRTAWLRGLHTPAWRRPRQEAERAWERLVLILDASAEQLSEPVWLAVWEALAAILEAYELDRKVIPVPGISQAPGFEAVVRPIIERRIANEQALLAGLKNAAKIAAESERPPLDAAQLQTFLDRIDSLTDRPADQRHSREPGTASEDDPSQLDRLRERAPSLVRGLGEEKALIVARGATDEALDLMEGISYRRAYDANAGAQVDILFHKIQNGLAECPDYTGRVRREFDLITWDLVTFIASRHDLETSGDLAYLKPIAGGKVPGEEALQTDYLGWIQRGHLAGRAQPEARNVATGRADIQVNFGTVRFFIEVKRETSNASDAAMEKSYLIQAADYSGTNPTLGQLIVLDLTKHDDGVRHLRDCVWVTKHRPTGSATDRYIVVGIVIGNRGTPRSYSH